MESKGKELSHPDFSAFELSKKLLDGHPTKGFNFERIMWNKKDNCYYLLEYLLCDVKQERNPWSSDPNRYFWGNYAKFCQQWLCSLDLKAKYFLVNYSNEGDFHNLYRLMEVDYINPDGSGKDFSIMLFKPGKQCYELEDWFLEKNDEAGGRDLIEEVRMRYKNLREGS